MWRTHRDERSHGHDLLVDLWHTAPQRKAECGMGRRTEPGACFRAEHGSVHDGSSVV